MYDDEEEIKRKRRNLIIAIGVIVGLIILLIILLVAGSSGKKKTKTVTPQCELIVTSNTPQKENGAYTGPITIGFDKDKFVVTKGLSVAEQRVGLQESQRNGETYTLSKSGTTTVYGYIKDSKGNAGTCSKDFTIESARPNCELEVKSGTLGENGWYTSNVEVVFKSKTVEGGTIEKWSIEEVKRDLENDEILNRAPEDNNDTYTVTADAETEVIGRVVDNNNVEATCMLKIKKDATKPTCALEVTSGTAGANGNYTTDVEIGMKSAEDATSTLAGKGVGTTENYTTETVKITEDGKHVVNGYVKDAAGNKGTCNITVTKGKSGGSSSGDKTTSPSCALQISGEKQGSNYVGTVKVSFKSKKTTNGAEITSFGLGTSSQLNGTSNLSVSDLGSHTIYGMVKDSDENTAECRISFTIAKKQTEQPSSPYCSLTVDAASNGSGGYYPNVTVKFSKYGSSNGAKIVEYGIGTKVQLSGNDTYGITSPGSYTIYGNVRDSYGHTNTCKVTFEVTAKPSTPTTTYTLATKTLKAGDIVNYPKNSKSIVCGNAKDVAGPSGWVVYRVTSSGVELITRGVPECYAKTSSETAATAISKINDKGSTYLDRTYATSVRFMDYNDAMSYGNNSNASANAKRNIGVVYWLASQGTKNVNMYAVRNNASSALAGQVYEGNYLNSGIRPIVLLKSTIYVKKNSSGTYDLSTTAKDAGLAEEVEDTMHDKLVEIVGSTLLADFVIE